MSLSNWLAKSGEGTLEATTGPVPDARKKKLMHEGEHEDDETETDNDTGLTIRTAVLPATDADGGLTKGGLGDWLTKSAEYVADDGEPKEGGSANVEKAKEMGCSAKSATAGAGQYGSEHTVGTMAKGDEEDESAAEEKREADLEARAMGEEDEPEDDEGMEKAEGEGTRGGNVIGHTTSGKPIYATAGKIAQYSSTKDRSSIVERYKGWSPKDHNEAADLHERHSDAGAGAHHAPMRDFHREMLTNVGNSGGATDSRAFSEARSHAAAAQKRAASEYRDAKKDATNASMTADSEDSHPKAKAAHATALRLAHAAGNKAAIKTHTKAMATHEDATEKSLDDGDLRKGEGEGSRGGKIVGHTGGGKPIYDRKGAPVSAIQKRHERLSKEHDAKKQQGGDAGKYHAAMSDFHARTARDHGNKTAGTPVAQGSASAAAAMAVADKHKASMDSDANAPQQDNYGAGFFAEQTGMLSPAEKEDRASNTHTAAMQDPSHATHTAAADAHAELSEVVPDGRKATVSRLADKHRRLAATYRTEKSIMSSDLMKAKAKGSKANEGSRGGTIIGHTASGKPIYQSGKNAASYTPYDHDDAAVAHNRLSSSHTNAKEDANEMRHRTEDGEATYNAHRDASDHHQEVRVKHRDAAMAGGVDTMSRHGTPFAEGSKNYNPNLAAKKGKPVYKDFDPASADVFRKGMKKSDGLSNWLKSAAGGDMEKSDALRTDDEYGNLHKPGATSAAPPTKRGSDGLCAEDEYGNLSKPKNKEQTVGTGSPAPKGGDALGVTRSTAKRLHQLSKATATVLRTGIADVAVQRVVATAWTALHKSGEVSNTYGEVIKAMSGGLYTEEPRELDARTGDGTAEVGRYADGGAVAGVGTSGNPSQPAGSDGLQAGSPDSGKTVRLSDDDPKKHDKMKGNGLVAGAEDSVSGGLGADRRYGNEDFSKGERGDLDNFHRPTPTASEIDAANAAWAARSRILNKSDAGSVVGLDNVRVRLPAQAEAIVPNVLIKSDGLVIISDGEDQQISRLLKSDSFYEGGAAPTMGMGDLNKSTTCAVCGNGTATLFTSCQSCGASRLSKSAPATVITAPPRVVDPLIARAAPEADLYLPNGNKG